MSKLFISGLSAELGSERSTVEDAVKLAQYTNKDIEADGYVSLAREPSRTSYEMALGPARRALEEASLNARDLAAITYASIHRHGQPRLWSPASWLQRQLGAPATIPALAIQQGCSSLLQAMLAQKSVFPLHASSHLLFVGADRFEASGFDRWKSDYGLIYGDAAAAVVISSDRGFARIVHLDMDGAPELEEFHRDDHASDEGPESWKYEYNVRRSKKAFLSKYGQEGFTKPINEALTRLRMRLTSHQEWTGSVDWVLTPFVGSKARSNTYEAAFAEFGRHSGWQIGRELGHLGTTDGWVGLSVLRERKAVSSGDRVLIVVAGLGYSCGVALVELL